MKDLLLLTLFTLSTFLSAQIEKKDISYGEIILVTDEKVTFRDLKWSNDKASYTNIETNELEQLYDASIKSITEKKPLVKEEKPNLYKANFPEGIYQTKEEFISKTPSINKELVKKGFYGFEKPVVDDEEQMCFFYEAERNKKIKNVFAVVNNGILYFNIKSILKNRNKTDRAQSSDFPNGFVRVIAGGKNYLYAEAILANAWSKGLGYGIGGGIGSAVSSTSDNHKGFVWDFKNTEFNIFKNCKDYNQFLKDKLPNDRQKCEKNQPDISLVRISIEKIL